MSMMLSRGMALIALAVFMGFLAIIAFRLNRTDLYVLIAICLGLALYDLWTQLGRRRP
jgi:uncharacterized protein (DUF486 family)